MTNEGKAVIQQYLINAINNLAHDETDSSFANKVIRAAVKATPKSLTVDTQPVLEYIDKRYPSLNLMEDNGRPENIMDMSNKAARIVDENNKLIIAYHESKMQK